MRGIYNPLFRCVIFLVLIFCNPFFNPVLFAQKVFFKIIGESGNPIPNVNIVYKAKIDALTKADGMVEARVFPETLEEMYQTNGKDIIAKGYEKINVEINKNERLFTIKLKTSSNSLQAVVVTGSLKNVAGEVIKNFGLSFVSTAQNSRKEATTDAEGNFEMKFGNEKEWSDFFAKEVDVILSDNSMEIENIRIKNKNSAITIKKKEIKNNQNAENTKKEEKKNTIKAETNPEAKGNENAAETKRDDSQESQEAHEGTENAKNKNKNWIKWVDLHLKNPQEVAKLPEKEKQVYVTAQIDMLKKDDKFINEQIKSLEETLKNDNTLSEKEKLDLTEELNKLKRRLYLNKLALGDLETQLAELQKSFWEKYRNLLLGAIAVIVVLSVIIYLMALLARTRKRQRDDLSLKNKEIEEKNVKITQEQQASEKLLLNILPATTAQELKKNGKVEPRLYPSVTTLFTDFKGFSGMAKNLSPQEVISQLAFYFEGFEEICQKYRLEKIKTIGDAFMAVAGLPLEYKQHALCAVGAGLAMQRFINDNPPPLATVWGVRIGLHTGEAVAGVIGQSKFAYDIWGNAVNVASRMESSGEAGEVQISNTTYDQIKEVFACSPRGKIEAKNIGMIDAYFVERLKPEYSQDKQGYIPNDKFWALTTK